MIWWGVMCLLVSGAFFFNAWGIRRRRMLFLSTAVPSQATVVDVQIEGLGKNRVAFPVFEFAVAGATHRARSMEGTGFQAFAIGQNLPIVYDPQNPSRAEVNTRATLWGTAMLRGGFSVLFLLIGLIGITIGLVRG